MLWLQDTHVVCAFEVEKSTSIYSGILRLQDLSLSRIARSFNWLKKLALGGQIADGM